MKAGKMFEKERGFEKTGERKMKKNRLNHKPSTFLS